MPNIPDTHSVIGREVMAFNLETREVIGSDVVEEVIKMPDHWAYVIRQGNCASFNSGNARIVLVSRLPFRCQPDPGAEGDNLPSPPPPQPLADNNSDDNSEDDSDAPPIDTGNDSNDGDETPPVEPTKPGNEDEDDSDSGQEEEGANDNKALRKRMTTRQMKEPHSLSLLLLR